MVLSTFLEFKRQQFAMHAVTPCFTQKATRVANPVLHVVKQALPHWKQTERLKLKHHEVLSHVCIQVWRFMSLLKHPIMHCPWSHTCVMIACLAEEVRWTDHLTIVSEGSVWRQLLPHDRAHFYMLSNALCWETRQLDRMQQWLCVSYASPHVNTMPKTRWHQDYNVILPSDMEIDEDIFRRHCWWQATWGNSELQGGGFYHKWVQNTFVHVTWICKMRGAELHLTAKACIEH